MNSKIKLGIVMVAVGLLSGFLSGGLWIYNIKEEDRVADLSQRVVQMLFTELDKEDMRVSDIKESESVEMSDGSKGMKYVVIDENEYFSILYIPGLDLTLPVSLDWSYKALKEMPCRYSGDFMSNNLVIAAHNYYGHFGNISKLKNGAEVILTDMYGNEFRYNVQEIETVAPTSIDHVINSQYDLTLLTCTYGGQARVIVGCNLDNKGL